MENADDSIVVNPHVPVQFKFYAVNIRYRKITHEPSFFNPSEIAHL